MNPRIAALSLEITALNDQVLAIHDEVDAKQEGKETEEQKAQVIALNKQIEQKELEMTGMKEWQDLRAEADARNEVAKTPVSPHAFVQRLMRDKPEEKRLADYVLGDPDFKKWLEAVCPNGQPPAKGQQFGHSPGIAMKSLITGLSSTSGGAFVVTDRQPIIDGGVAMRELTLMDLITVSSTTSDIVDYVRQGVHTNNAAPVAEATATGDATGAKPESGMVFSVITETVRNIAHWMPITRRALADAPMLRDLIDTWLRYGLREEMEDQMITGDGAGENFTGVLNVSGTGSQAWDTNFLTTTRKARTKVKLAGRATANGYVLHPLDWEAADLLQDNEARYYFGGPSVLGTPRLWGLPVIECEGMTQGTGMVADWRKAWLWLRDQARILVSDSHSDFFIRNLVAVLAEERAAFGVTRPLAFVEIDTAA